MRGEQLSNLGIQCGDPAVEVVDVTSELSDAARGGALREALAELDALELSQLALAITADDAALSDGVKLCPV